MWFEKQHICAVRVNACFFFTVRIQRIEQDVFSLFINGGRVSQSGYQSIPQTLVPGPFQRVPQSWLGGYPSHNQQDTPALTRGRYLRTGYPPNQPGLGCPQDITGVSSRAELGYPFGTGYAAGGTPGVVSRRSTSLLSMSSALALWIFSKVSKT